MTLIPLSSGRSAKVDDADVDMLNLWRWRAHWVDNSQKWEVVSRNKPPDRVYMNRLLLGLMRGDKLNACHINGDTLDCQRVNLEALTPRERRRKSQVKMGRLVGAIRVGSKWVSQVKGISKMLYLGSYGTQQEAHQAYLNYCLDKQLM
jgi:hypothetical protein